MLKTSQLIHMGGSPFLDGEIPQGKLDLKGSFKPKNKRVGPSDH